MLAIVSAVLMEPHAHIRHRGARRRQVLLRGWLYNKRSSGKLHFLEVRDGTGIVQAWSSRATSPPRSSRGPTTSRRRRASRSRGTVKEDTRAPVGFELRRQGLRGRRARPREYPITPKEHGIDFLHGPPPPVAARRRGSTRSCACAHTIIKAIRDFFDERGFTLVDAPIFTPTACEGTSDALRDRLLRRARPTSRSRASSTWRPRAMAFGKVYCFGPTFRAEKSQDAPAPHRVLDGRARGRVHGPRGRHGARRGLLSLHRRRVLDEAPRRSSQGRSSATSTKLEARADAVPAHHLRRGDREPAEGNGHPDQVGRRLRRRRGDGRSRSSSTGR